ncbi:hypothetical protein ICW40_20540 [Actinotalea ferrariae]|uniref:hypothetical protein n=1 Tax=Actinotalea ferrariae TaxID=1386098 RepID=UPI001C8B9718|nr:hypothetical protein [Actinotalea ferrariae]MBX9247185.1 hypothetical protein [Actinotalea ferrariae]
MHPLTVYEIAVREHERETSERSLDRLVRRRLQGTPAADRRPTRTARLLHPRASAASAAGAQHDGRPAVA